MNRIDTATERSIKEKADIYNVVSEFVELRKKGSHDYEGLCPFHDDRNLGNFVVSPARNVASCFACGWHGGPIDFLMKHEDISYGEALRWLADKYHIYISEDNTTTYTKRPMKPVVALPTEAYDERELKTFDLSLVKAQLKQEGNTLIYWLRSLPWTKQEMEMLNKWLQLYGVGTCTRGDEMGWTIWWYIDENMKVRTGKMMKYKADGHRDKESKYNTNWVHSKLAKAGRFDLKHYRTEQCLFGLHLLNAFPDAEIHIVESEKTAIIAQTVSLPGERIFMATGAKGALTKKMLQPLIDAERKIILYPDIDGIDEWRKTVADIGYPKMQLTKRLQRLYDPKLDSPKSDIADIIIRRLDPKPRILESLGAIEGHPELEQLIDTFHLTLYQSK